MLCSHRPRQKRFQVTNSNQIFIQKHVLGLYGVSNATYTLRILF